MHSKHGEKHNFEKEQFAGILFFNLICQVFHLNKDMTEQGHILWILLISLVNLRHFLLSSIELFNSNFLKKIFTCLQGYNHKPKDRHTRQLYIIHRPINQFTLAFFRRQKRQTSMHGQAIK